MVKINQRTLDLVKEFEGFYSHPYADVGYGWQWGTIGYGTTTYPDGPLKGRLVKKGDPPIDRATAERWLRLDLERKYGPAVARAVKVPLSADSFGALVSFAYNVGSGGLARSTLLKRVNAKRWDDVEAQFMRWNKSNGRVFRGLTRRRKAEARQFLSGLKAPTQPPPDPMAPITQPDVVIPPLPAKKPTKRVFVLSWILDWFR